MVDLVDRLEQRTQMGDRPGLHGCRQQQKRGTGGSSFKTQDLIPRPAFRGNQPNLHPPALLLQQLPQTIGDRLRRLGLLLRQHDDLNSGVGHRQPMEMEGKRIEVGLVDRGWL
jgi:hypothetical protein